VNSKVVNENLMLMNFHNLEVHFFTCETLGKWSHNLYLVILYYL
jgi:hypothetical protein